MVRTVKLLLLSALILLGSGWALYDFGSQLNLAISDSDPMLWNEAPGDKWLYLGGLMMLISGSLAAAAFRFWRGSRREVANATLNGFRNQSR